MGKAGQGRCHWKLWAGRRDIVVSYGQEGEIPLEATAGGEPGSTASQVSGSGLGDHHIALKRGMHLERM